MGESVDLDDVSVHVTRHRQSHHVQYRRRNVRDVRVEPLAAGLIGRVVQDVHTLLRVIGVVGAGVVFERVHVADAQAAHRAPIEIAKVHHQIRRDAFDLFVDFLWSERNCADLATVRRGDGFERLR